MNPQASGVIAPLPGDPEQVRRIAAQFTTVETRAQEIQSRLRSIESGVGPQMWRGQAADGFTVLLAANGPDLTTLATSYGAAGRALTTYATELAAAQDAARAAEAQAATATEALARARADRDSARSDADRDAATAADAQLRMDPVTAQDAERRRTDALARENTAAAAVDQAERSLRAVEQKAGAAAARRSAAAARCVGELADAGEAGIAIRNLGQGSGASAGPPPADSTTAVDAVGRNVLDDLREKWALHVTDFAVNGVVGGLVAKHVVILGKEGDRLREEGANADKRYRNSPGGSAEATFQNARAHDKRTAADEVERRAASISRSVGGKLPVIGLGITAVGIGYDISQGKPIGQAVVSGVGGALFAVGTGAVIGTAVAGPLGTVVGAGIGLIAGVGMSGYLEYTYDELPQGVKDAIDNGTQAVGNAIGDAGEAVASGARRVWDAIF